MTTTIYLIRHGETEWNRSGRWQGHADVPLTEEGRYQADALARRLLGAGVRFDHVYASDLSRAYETADAIARRLEATVERFVALREIDVGSWSGLTRAQIVERNPDAFTGVFHPEDGEGWDTFTDRTSRALRDLAARHPNQTIAIVTHGGVIRAMLKELYERQGQHDQHIATIGNTSVTELQWADGVWSVLRFNDISHLDPAHQAPDMLARPNEGSEVA